MFPPARKLAYRLRSVGEKFERFGGSEFGRNFARIDRLLAQIELHRLGARLQVQLVEINPKDAGAESGFEIIALGVCVGHGAPASADNNAATGLYVPTPENVPPKTGAFVGASCGVLSNATWSNGHAYVDSADTTAANRRVVFPTNAWPTMTDGQAMAAACSFIYEVDGAIDWSSYMGPLFTTGTPASPTVNARVRVVNGEWCWFEAYYTSADSNGATSLTMKPPVVPLKTTGSTRLNCYILNDTTVVAGAAYLDSSQTDPDDRLIRFSLHPTCTDAKTVTYRISGFFKVAG